MRKRSIKLLKKYVLILLYIILINILLTFSTISLHELGHFLVGMAYECKNIRIILFDIGNLSTYTEMKCDQGVSVKIIAIGSLFIATPIALAFLLLKQRPERFYGVMIIGLNIIIAVTDIQKVIDSQILYFSEFIVGLSVVIWAEILMINSILNKRRRI